MSLQAALGAVKLGGLLRQTVVAWSSATTQPGGLISALDGCFVSHRELASSSAAAKAKGDQPSTSGAKSQQPATSANDVQVILRQDVRGLGRRGDIVVTKAGRMRLKLFPAGLAAYATPENLSLYALSEDERVERSETAEEQRVRLDKCLKALAQKPVVVSRRAAADNAEVAREPVEPSDVLKAVSKQLRIQLDASHLMFADAITAFGTYKIPLNLRDANDAQIELTLHVDKRGKDVTAAAATQ